MYDAIVVGARCAGSPTAMLLAQKGYRVLMVDRAGFPSDTMSTHYIHQPGVAQLRKWGLLETLAASNCPPVRQITLDFGPFALTGSPPPFDGVAEGYAPRRTVLDKILVDAAVEAGVEVREHFTVKELISDGDQITGIRGHSAGGPMVSESARLVIGADGLHSMVARSVQAESYNATPSLTCAYYSYWADVPLKGVELYSRPNQMFGTGPTNDGMNLVIVFWPVAAFHQVRTDIEGHFWKALDKAPDFAERLRSGKQAERFRGSADLRNFYRKPFGPGWALVGDAGFHKDPGPAQGITDGFRDAELLANAIDEGFSGLRSLDDALADYERTRNEVSAPLYDMTLQMASLQPPPPEQQQLIGALIDNQEQTDRFFGTIAGTVPIAEFYSPANIDAIFGANAAAA